MPLFATGTKRADLRFVPSIEIETVSDYPQFLNLEPVWNRVLRASRLDHPFVEHAWIRTWWECFGRNSKLRVLLAKEAGEVIAIAPLILTPIRMWGIPVRRLGFFYNSHVPRADFIISKRAGEVYQAIWRSLSGTREWDILQLCQLPEGCETLTEMTRLASMDGCSHGVWNSGASPYIELDKPWSEYYDTLASKHRANLRNRLKRLKEIGTVELEAVTSKETVPKALEAGFQIEAAAWKGEAGTAITCDPMIEKFYRVFAERAAARGWLRLHFLKAGAKAAAFDYSLSYKNQVFLLKLGYDPAFSPYSPSNLLLCMALEAAFDQGLVRYDFLGESGEWKLCWSKTARTNCWMFVFPNTMRGRALHFLKFRAVPLLKKLRTRSH